MTIFGAIAEEAAVLDRALAIEPNDVETKAARAEVEFDWKANIRPFHQLIDELARERPWRSPKCRRWLVWLRAGRTRPCSCCQCFSGFRRKGLENEAVKYSPHFGEGLIARMTKDDAKAFAAFTAARTDQEKWVRAHPDDAIALCVLGLTDAALGRKEEALREGRSAVQLLPVEKDAVGGKRVIMWFAEIAAWVGDNDLACEQLAVAIQPPSQLSYGELKLMPWWDPLRGDPCFEKIVASLAPKSN